MHVSLVRSCGNYFHLFHHLRRRGVQIQIQTENHINYIFVSIYVVYDRSDRNFFAVKNEGCFILNFKFIYL